MARAGGAGKGSIIGRSPEDRGTQGHTGIFGERGGGINQARGGRGQGRKVWR